MTFTYQPQTQIHEWLLNFFDKFTVLAYYLLLKHALKHHRYEAFPLTSTANVYLVAKARLNQVLE